MRSFLARLSFTTGLFVPLLGAASEQLPNILFIMTDQHRWDCVGANGNTLIQTPK